MRALVPKYVKAAKSYLDGKESNTKFDLLKNLVLGQESVTKAQIIVKKNESTPKIKVYFLSILWYNIHYDKY